jgi:hypothetical protein
MDLQIKMHWWTLWLFFRTLLFIAFSVLIECFKWTLIVNFMVLAGFGALFLCEIGTIKTDDELKLLAVLHPWMLLIVLLDQFFLGASVLAFHNGFYMVYSNLSVTKQFWLIFVFVLNFTFNFIFVRAQIYQNVRRAKTISI